MYPSKSTQFLLPSSSNLTAMKSIPRNQFLSNLSQIISVPNNYITSLFIKTKSKLFPKYRRNSLSFKLPQSTTLMKHLNILLSSIHSIHFDIFYFKSSFFNSTSFFDLSTNSKLLFLLSKQIFSFWNLLPSYISESKLKTFTYKLSKMYNNNPYHNIIHACDVLQTTHVILKEGDFLSKTILNREDVFAILIAAMIHDIKHPGVSNNYLISSYNKLALKYNNISPLENMHLYEGIKLINKLCLFETINEYKKEIIKKRMIQMILGTDGTQHEKVINAVKCKIDEIIKSNNTIQGDKLLKEYLNSSANVFQLQQHLMTLILHCADISNPAKKYENIYSKWTEYIMKEFFNEGDLEREKGLPMNFLCDRNTTIIQKGQINFIKGIVLPTFLLLNRLIPSIKGYVNNLYENIEIYNKQLEEMNDKNNQS